jgi:hypothetical protein
VAAIPFQIEFAERDRGFVIARALEPRPFRLAPDSTLGACPVSAMSMPKASNPDGSPRTDLFAFRLVYPDDVSELRVGSIVELANYRDA